jgi:hypothetical protein
MVCKLAQKPSEIWMTLPVESKKWFLNELKCKQEEDDSKRSYSSSGTKDKNQNF